MKKELYRKIKIPEGIEAELEGKRLKIKGPEGEITKKFNLNSLEFTKKENEISIGSKKSTKREKKLMNTIAAHISNMIEGVQKKFEYELKAVFSHFPITVEAKEKEIFIKNFLGEKTPRKTRIPEGVEIKIEGNIIRISSVDKELAGQTAANFETVTRIKAKDRRVFQDGIFITKKPKGEI
jgi:large subunit ribosomal protein L6